MHWSPDEEGINGIYLDKCIIEEAGKVGGGAGGGRGVDARP